MDFPRHIFLDDHSLTVIASNASGVCFGIFLAQFRYISFYALVAVNHVDSCGWRSPNSIAVLNRSPIEAGRWSLTCGEVSVPFASVCRSDRRSQVRELVCVFGVATSVTMAIFTLDRAQAAELGVEISDEGSETRDSGRDKGEAEFGLCPYDEDGFGKGWVRDSIGFIEVCKAEGYGNDDAST